MCFTFNKNHYHYINNIIWSDIKRKGVGGISRKVPACIPNIWTSTRKIQNTKIQKYKIQKCQPAYQTFEHQRGRYKIQKIQERAHLTFGHQQGKSGGKIKSMSRLNFQYGKITSPKIDQRRGRRETTLVRWDKRRIPTPHSFLIIRRRQYYSESQPDNVHAQAKI